MSIGSNVSANIFSQSTNFLDPIVSAPQYNSPNVTFVYDVASTKGVTDDELFYDIP